MADNRRKTADTAAMVALIVVILIASIAFAQLTDWHIVVRGLVALVLGLIAAVTTFIVVGRASKRRED